MGQETFCPGGNSSQVRQISDTGCNLDFGHFRSSNRSDLARKARSALELGACRRLGTTCRNSSYTKGRQVELMASPEFLRPSDRILIVDDFLATGQTISALVRLVEKAGAKLVGIGTLIEKRLGGRALLEGLGVPIESLVVIADMSNGRIVFAE